MIAVLAYRGVSSGEVDTPVTCLADRMDANVCFVGPHVGVVHGVEPSRPVEVSHHVTNARRADVLVVPGGLGWKQVAADPATSTWLAGAANDARGILAMSTGTLLLASVGRLTGRNATGHWLADDDLAALGARPASSRTAADDDGRVVTASGALAALGVVDALADHVRWAQWMPTDASS